MVQGRSNKPQNKLSSKCLGGGILGSIYVSILGVIKGDTCSLENGSNRLLFLLPVGCTSLAVSTISCASCW